MSKFEVVSKYADAAIEIPKLATAGSGGYDLAAAQDYIIPSYWNEMSNLEVAFNECDAYEPISLDEVSAITKSTGIKPTLVSTGLKCQLDEGKYLKVVARSSLPLKHWLIVANAEGIIDRDYYNNQDNEGEVFVQLINLGPRDIIIKKGERIAQAIISSYSTTEDSEYISKERSGGHGSTGR